MDDKLLRRARLDYLECASVREHRSWQTFRDSFPESRLLAISTRGARSYHEIRYRADDALLFGPESRGLPQALLDEVGDRHVLRIPMLAESRSLNLANAVTVVVYEAWRQFGFVSPSLSIAK